MNQIPARRSLFLAVNRFIYIIVACLALSISLTSCRNHVPTAIALGEFLPQGSQSQTLLLPVDVPNIDSSRWLIRLVWSQVDKEVYNNTNLTISVINTGGFPIATSQNTGWKPGDSIILDVPPGKKRVVYKGTAGEFIGLDAQRPDSELAIWTPDSKHLKCEIEVELGKAQLTKPLNVGLSRYEENF